MLMLSKCQDWSITVGQEFKSLVLLQRFLAVGPATWEIVTVDENKHRSLAPELCLRIAQSSVFHLTALMPVLTDAMIAASKLYNANQPVRCANPPLVLDLFCVCPPSPPLAPNYQTRACCIVNHYKILVAHY